MLPTGSHLKTNLINDVFEKSPKNCQHTAFDRYVQGSNLFLNFSKIGSTLKKLEKPLNLLKIKQSLQNP